MDDTTFKAFILHQAEQSGLSYSAALIRCGGLTGVSLPTLWKVTRGGAVTPRIARLLSEYTGGEVDAGRLALGQED